MHGVASTAETARLALLVGPDIFRRARSVVDAGLVGKVQWHPNDQRAFGEVRTGAAPSTAMVTAEMDARGTIMALRSHCTCNPRTGHCVHAIAVLLAALRDPAELHVQEELPIGRDTSKAWERALARLIPLQADDVDETPQLGLQFDLMVAGEGRGAERTRIGLRPVVPGTKGNWIRGNISWQSMHYAGFSAHSARQLRLLKEVLGLYKSSGHYHGYARDLPFLDEAPSRRIWDLLAEAEELGLPLVQAAKGNPPVALSPECGEAVLDVARSRSGLDLSARIMVDGVAVDLRSAVLLGEPAHGLAWWDSTGQRVLHLAQLRAPVEPELRSLLLGGTAIEVPAEDEERFLSDYVPLLRQRIGLTAGDVAALPQVAPPVLALTAEHRGSHQLSLSWSWTYTVGDVSRSESLWAPRHAGRDRDAESDLLRAVTSAVGSVPSLLENYPGGRRLAATADVGGMETVRVLNDLLPVLSELESVSVTVVLAPEVVPPAYQEVLEAPLISVAGDPAADDRDWFDLSVSVSVGGESVPFDELFVALASASEHLILSSGTYFSLDRAEFTSLRALIEEARSLADARPGGSLRVSRFQAGLWEELDRLGVVSGQAAAWLESVRALASVSEVPRHEVPSSLNAVLRPYQREGFDWLATLHDFGLGGVLADDMGLGKTVQTLALIAHAAPTRPFLVVAPTSVVFNWTSEAERFVPGLRTVAINETESRRGRPLAEVVEGAHIVVTSYTLFRLEFEAYESLSWAGLVLDEAQFVKNHQSQAYRCAKRLPAPFKLAITGTPMENHLMELWSLLSITAPGLFPQPAKFTAYYRNPIEKQRDATRLEQLRQRIRPLMLRRTKSQVVADLPDKQEQVIELELNPKHRKVYETHLQRERQKVLGLLDDVDKNRFEIFRSLTMLRQASIDAFLVDPAYDSVPSTKLDAVMELVDDVVREGHRTLIFSQFTRFLGRVRDRLVADGVPVCYLDGSTTDRAAVLSEWKDGDAPVFLISLKAGGFGLNLTEADYCILLDPWWNPATEAQAVDRIHRIGQTRKVMVYRLVAKDTIEQKVMALKASKSALFSSVVDGGDFESGALSVSDIRGLLD